MSDVRMMRLEFHIPWSMSASVTLPRPLSTAFSILPSARNSVSAARKLARKGRKKVLSRPGAVSGRGVVALTGVVACIGAVSRDPLPSRRFLIRPVHRLVSQVQIEGLRAISAADAGHGDVTVEVRRTVGGNGLAQTPRW